VVYTLVISIVRLLVIIRIKITDIRVADKIRERNPYGMPRMKLII